VKKSLIIILGSLLSLSTSAQLRRNLDFLTNPKSSQIEIRKKVYKNSKDSIFVDGLGREVSLRGWNINSMAKLPKFGFKPFPLEQGDAFFDDFSARTGANIIRWVINWEATHLDVETIDNQFLSDTVALLKKAIKRKLFILLDYHQDLFSRWIPIDGVAPKSAVDGWDQDGAPKWVIEGMDLPYGSCGKICVAWSQNYFTNSATKKAHRIFWNNEWIETKKGKRKIQDLFFWQMEKVLTYIKEHLSPKEFDFILGIDPWNEPSEGGLRAYNPPLTPHRWTNEKLMPFHLRTREILDKTGYEKKFVFAEPSTFWNFGLFFISPRGEFKIDHPPTKGFVFNGHFYDEKRQTFTNINPGQNGVYLKEFEAFRVSARNINGPSFVSEFGGWWEKRAGDSHRITKSIYQAMETTPPKKSNRANFYSPLISGTQWEWKAYYDYEKNKPILDKGFDQTLLARSYPRRTQGDIMHFYYNDTVKARYKNRELNWMGIQAGKEILFSKNKFSLLVWRGRKSEAPTEIYLPHHFDPKKTLILTENHIFYGKGIPSSPKGSKNEIFLMKDLFGKGHRLFIYDDPEEGEWPYHFTLSVELSNKQVKSESLWKEFRKQIFTQIKKEASPLRFLGKVKMDKPRKARPHRVPFMLEGK